MGLKEKASNIKESENKDTCNNEKGTSAKKEYLCGNLSKNNGCYKQPMKISILPILDLLLSVTIEDLLLVKTGLFRVSSQGSGTLTANYDILSFLTNSVLKYVCYVPIRHRYN
ncbi:hypothetical protein PMALA_044270 [Plasmodium malariae]|uniref:Uncharacterized protein n=1 Tax=Plasmodium malariae TaxID=5858 RepID=A0A1A8WTI5_PLAMA|nr:hypothetical protein PMALA_044270 [Plasmodium malariae]